VSAVLHHAHVDITLRRPAGAKGRVRTGWLNPADARTIIAAAETLDTEFAETCSCSTPAAASARRSRCPWHPSWQRRHIPT
jgi:hypothetical protein